MNEETVKVTITVEVPKKAKELLEKFAETTNTTLEDIFLENIGAALRSFYSGGFYEVWTKADLLARDTEKQFDC